MNSLLDKIEEADAIILGSPMYLGMVLILLGSLTPFLIVALFAVIMEVVFIKVEEQMMQETFGSHYIEHKQKVRK